MKRNTNEQHGKANVYVPDQVYQGPDGFWRVAFKGHVLPDERTSRQAAEDHLNSLRRVG
jgi:hypothetical protein